MELSKLVKKNIAGKFYYTDDKNYFTEYTIKSDDSGLKQIAKDQLHNENLYMDILRLNSGKAEMIVNKNLICPDWTLLLPVASPFGK